MMNADGQSPSVILLRRRIQQFSYHPSIGPSWFKPTPYTWHAYLMLQASFLGHILCFSLELMPYEHPILSLISVVWLNVCLCRICLSVSRCYSVATGTCSFAPTLVTSNHLLVLLRQRPPDPQLDKSASSGNISLWI